jgi:DNA invertase Pin-like site-specific DNA recombinase
LLDYAEKKCWKTVVLDVEVDTTTAAGRLVVEVVNATASFESRRTGERQKAVHAVRRAQGKRAGQAPIVPYELRSLIRRVHEDGQSPNAIARTLDEEGVPTARGGQWHASTISHVLRSIQVDQELAKQSKSQWINFHD